MGPPPPKLKIPQFGSQRPRDPKNRIPRVRFMKIRPGGRSGDLNRTDLRPYLGLAHVCSSLPSCMSPPFLLRGPAEGGGRKARRRGRRPPFGETDTRKPTFGVPGPLGAKLIDLGVVRVGGPCML